MKIRTKRRIKGFKRKAASFLSSDSRGHTYYRYYRRNGTARKGDTRKLPSALVPGRPQNRWAKLMKTSRFKNQRGENGVWVLYCLPEILGCNWCPRSNIYKTATNRFGLLPDFTEYTCGAIVKYKAFIIRGIGIHMSVSNTVSSNGFLIRNLKKHVNLGGGC